MGLEMKFEARARDRQKIKEEEKSRVPEVNCRKKLILENDNSNEIDI